MIKQLGKPYHKIYSHELIPHKTKPNAPIDKHKKQHQHPPQQKQQHQPQPQHKHKQQDDDEAPAS
ncbi:DUF6392 family protein [Klebsiella pneumoniae]|nr:DUF6392 family protein [Klebsiella pneumoniae]